MGEINTFEHILYRLILREKRKWQLKTDRRNEIREAGEEGDGANDGHSNSRKQFPPSQDAAETNLFLSLKPHGFKQKHTCIILYF